MKSKTSFFNRTLFFNLLKRYWPIFAGYFLIWLIIMPVALANLFSYTSTQLSATEDIRTYIANIGSQVLNLGLFGGAILSAIFAMLLAMAAFNYLYNPRSVSMMCSLPIKREGVFLSVFSSGLAGMLFINVVIFLISLGVEAAYGAFAFAPVYLLQWLAMVCMMNLFFYGFASLCASFTGHILVLPIVYVVLNFTVYVVEFLSKAAMNTFIYGISMRDSYILTPFSPLVRLLTHSDINAVTEPTSNGAYMAVGYTYAGWKTLAIYAAVGIVFSILAMLIIKHRRMETAGDVVAVKPLKPIFKYCLSVGCALVLGIGIHAIVFSSANTRYGLESMLLLLLLMLFGALIGYFAAEMLLQKTLRVFGGHNWLGFGLTALIIVGLLFAGEYDLFGYEKRLPDANEVQGVSINCAGEDVLFEQPENIAATIALHGDIVSHKDANEQYTGNYEASSYNVSFLYTLKNGKTLARTYNIYKDASDDIYALNDLMNVQEAVDYRKTLSVPISIDTISDAYLSYFDINEEVYKNVELSAEQAYVLYTDCILPDMDAGALGKIWLVTDDSYYSSVYDLTVNFSVQQRLKDNDYTGDYFYTTLTVNSLRTNKWIEDNFGLVLCTKGESNEILSRQSAAYAEKAAA